MIINCKEIRENLLTEIKQEVDRIDTRIKACILTCEGFDFASSKYITNKIKTLESVGMACEVIDISGNDRAMTWWNIKSALEHLNEDKSIHGYLVQLPLPFGLTEKDFEEYIEPHKDLDAFSNINKGMLSSGDYNSILPCTPQAIIEILKRQYPTLEGLVATVVGKSNIVGKPISQMLLNEGVTVTTCHSKTKRTVINNSLRDSDIFISAIGMANYFNMKSESVGYDLTKITAIDVGINRDFDNKLCGDIDKKVYDEFKAVTPVPSGVGILTTVMVAKNLLKCYKLQNGEI